MPSQLICVLCMRFFGRKKLAITFLSIVFISSFFMIPLSIRVHFVLLGKFAINFSWWTLSLVRRELFPTVLRTTAHGTITIASRIGAVTAPFINQIVWSIIYYTVKIQFYSPLTLFTKWCAPSWSIKLNVDCIIHLILTLICRQI